MQSLNNVQQEFFQLIEDLFTSATGQAPNNFATLSGFADAVRSKPEKYGRMMKGAFEESIPKIRAFYSRNGMRLFDEATQLGGLKVLLGGGKFRRTQLNTVRRLLLYADTVLIPDPILPWIEMARTEEKFPNINLLEAAFFLLRLKPLIDAELGYPPVLIFQGWERTLIMHDEQVRNAESVYIGQVVSPYCEAQLSTVEDIALYAKENEKTFLEQVERHQLYVAPGGTVGEPLREAIKRYRAENQQWRTPVHNELLSSMSDSQFVCLGVFERLEPLFHHIRNANAFRAQPLFSIPANAHYFKISASSSDEFLVQNDVIKPETKATIETLSSQSFSWLGNAPIQALVEMRIRNENEKFRTVLGRYTALLNSAALQDLDRVSAEVSHGIGSLLNEHRLEADRIEQKYKTSFAGQAVGGWLSVAAAAIPHLAPFVAAVAPIKIAKDYVESKQNQSYDKQQLASSLIGILSASTNTDEDME